MTKEYKLGVTYTTFSYIIWGFLALYWGALSRVEPWTIISYRIFMCFISVLIMTVILHKREGMLEPLKNIKVVLILFLSGILITVNWSVYIWALTNNHVLDASMGYYINPLVSMVFGILIFKEKPNKYTLMAIGLAFLGVLIMIVKFGTVPYVALILAFSFGIYGVFKKQVQVPSLVALVYETFIVFPIVTVYLIYIEVNGTGVMGHVSLREGILILFSGIATALPLYLFAIGAKRIKLSTVGFLQYIAPTMMFFIGIFVYKETLNQGTLTGFIFIWTGIIVFYLQSIFTKKNAQNP